VSQSDSQYEAETRVSNMLAKDDYNSYKNDDQRNITSAILKSILQYVWISAN